MIVSIDASGLGAAKTGTAVYLLEILRAWNADKHIAHRFVIFTSPKARGYFADLGLDDRFAIRLAPDNRVVRIAWQQLVLPALIRRCRSHVHWGAGFVLPVLSSCPSVVAVHDLTFQLFPEVHEPIKRWYFPWMIRKAVRKARAIIAISATTERDLLALYPAAKGKTRVTLLAARGLPGTDRRGGGNPADGTPYVLAIGTLEPRKNLARLVRAWLAMDPGYRREVRLLIAGAYGWMMNDLLVEADQTWAAGIQLLGFVGERELAELLKNALALAYPSLYEGFGLPVLEAMAMGVPVLTSATGATLEVAGDAALLVDPRDEQSIRNGLERLLADAALREQLTEKGRVRAAEFSWETTARQTLDILEQVGSGGGQRVCNPGRADS